MARVTTADVATVTGEEASSTGVALSISVANTIVTEVCVPAGLAEALLPKAELYLAAHFVEVSARQGALAAETLGDATERYHNIYSAGLRSTRFGQQAMLIDTSGALAKMADQVENPQRKSALFTVVGDPPRFSTLSRT